MNQSDHKTTSSSPGRCTEPTFPGSSVLLAYAGYASLCLLAWQFLIVPYLPTESSLKWLLATVAISLLILAVLGPVIVNATGQERYLALLIAIFPTWVLLYPLIQR